MSEAGLAQAERLADALTGFGIDAIVSSPFARAIASVRPLAGRLDLKISIDDRLRERLLAPVALDDWLDHLRRSFDDFTYRTDGGESLHEAQGRGLSALADIASRGHRLPAVASHGNLIATLLNAAYPGWGFEQWRTMANPDLFRMTMREGAPIAVERVVLPA